MITLWGNVLAKFQLSVRNALCSELPLLLSWKRIAIATLLPAGILLFILFFLEPNGTDRYRSEWRSLRLSGYALCVILPSLAVHSFNLWFYRCQKNTWRLANEICSRSFTLLGMVSASYFYNAFIVNNVRVSLAEWTYFLLHFGLPYAVLLLPPLIYVEHWLTGAQKHGRLGSEHQKIAAEEVHSDVNTICIYGKNNEEQLKIPAAAFLYAEALQNYVSIVFLSGSEVPAKIEKRVFRTTLAEICLQIPTASRIHRSYLINPQHLLRFETNRRKRFAFIRHLEQPLPASAERTSN